MRSTIRMWLVCLLFGLSSSVANAQPGSARSQSGGELPPYTDYCAMLGQEIQGRKHAFLAGNLTYYVGGRYKCRATVEAWRSPER